MSRLSVIDWIQEAGKCFPDWSSYNFKQVNKGGGRAPVSTSTLLCVNDKVVLRISSLVYFSTSYLSLLALCKAPPLREHRQQSCKKKHASYIFSCSIWFISLITPNWMFWLGQYVVLSLHWRKTTIM